MPPGHVECGFDHYLKRNLIGDKSREGWRWEGVKCGVGRGKQCHRTGLEFLWFYFHFESGLGFL